MPYVATLLRARMRRAAAYNLGDQVRVTRELAAIRRGSGYLDLADDCEALAQHIRDDFRKAKSRARDYSALKARAFTELARLYHEVHAAALFVLRAERGTLSAFLPLRAAVKALAPRTPTRTRTRKNV